MRGPTSPRARAKIASRHIALYGTEHGPDDVQIFAAGCLSAELVQGRLRHIRVGETEVLREIAFIARDVNWVTAAAEFSDVGITDTDDGFSIRYTGRLCLDGVLFTYKARISADALNGLSFTVSGRAAGDLQTNRLGFVVLHPIDGVAGTAVQVEHTDGTLESSAFPSQVSGGRPFFDIRSLRHEFAPGRQAICRMTGDTFEMEDQRNWTDASFCYAWRRLSAAG